MAKNIDTKLENIQGIFSNSQGTILGKEGIFIIPDYQRAYNWKFNEQCDKLWQDIESFIENKKNESFFFGTIIINSDNERLYVIDGQQRITTFMLLLKSLYIKINDIMPGIPSDEDAEAIKNALKNRQNDIINCLYLIDRDDSQSIVNGTKDISSLKIKYENNSINEEYKDELKAILLGKTFEEIQSGVSIIKHKKKDNKYTNFFRNFKMFSEKIEDFDSTRINEFTKNLLEKCQIIVVISYQTEEAIEIFNSLNSTGMPLADADIISAKLYGNYDTEKEEFNLDWSEIVKGSSYLESQKICTIDDILNQYMLCAESDKRRKRHYASRGS